MTHKIAFYNSPLASMPTRQTRFENRSVNQALKALNIDPNQQTIVVGIGNDWVLRADWNKPVNDNISIYAVPADPATILVSILSYNATTIAGMAIFASLPTWLGASAVMLAGSMLIREVFPAAQTDISGRSIKSASPTYSINGQGNRLRTGEPMAELFGKCRLFPAYGVPPYWAFINGEQYLYEIFHITNGKAHIVKEFLGDNTIPDASFGFEKWKMFPGQNLPTNIFENIHTSKNISGRELKAPNEIKNWDSSGGWTQWINITPTDKKIKAIHLDMVAQGGLYSMDTSGNISNNTATYTIEIKDSNNVVTSHTKTLTGNGNKPIRITEKFNPPKTDEYKIRIKRTDSKKTTTRDQHSIAWAGLKGVLEKPLNLNDNATYILKRTRATNASQSLRGKYSVIAHRHLPTYNPTTKTWSQVRATQSIADSVAYILKKWLPEDEIDLESLYQLDAIWTARGDKINGVFDTATNTWEAIKKALACGRATPIRLWDTVTFIRDKNHALPQSLFTLSNIEAGSVNINYTLTTAEMADGIKVLFPNEENDFDQDKVEWVETGSQKRRVIEIRLPYITNKNQALREAKFRAREQLYRRKTVSFVAPTPPQALLYGSCHILEYPMITQSVCQGRVIDFNSVTKTLTLSDAVKFETGKKYALRVVDSKGQVSAPLPITSSSLSDSDIAFDFEDEDVKILTSFSLNIITEKSGLGNASTYVVNEATKVEQSFVITKVEPQGQDKVKITGIFDDARVHQD